MGLYPFVCFLFLLSAYSEFVWKRHQNKDLAQVLEEVHEKCPNITRVYKLPELSINKVPLYAIEFSDTPGIHDQFTPDVKFVGNIHGNEVLGRELLLSMAHYLCDQYLNHDHRVRTLVHTTRIHLLPATNTHGIPEDTVGIDYLIGRNNSKELNRNLLDWDTIIFDFEWQSIIHKNHLLKDVFRLAGPMVYCDDNKHRAELHQFKRRVRPSHRALSLEPYQYQC